MNKKQEEFVKNVWEHYHNFGRHNLLWRRTKNPYKILISEIMCQQTQVERVFPKYTLFLEQFPTVDDLASAKLRDVIIVWQGLGYNRRAKMLHECAQELVRTYDGTFPKSYESLKALPGIGPYTAGAILAFAFNTPVPVIETNIRTVYLHHFYKGKTKVTDTELFCHIEATLSRDNPREWYWALMDYGTYLKKKFGNPNNRSKHYTKQSTFKGSDRHIRGAIVKILAQEKRKITRTYLHTELTLFKPVRIDAQLKKLVKEKLLTQTGKTYMLA